MIVVAVVALLGFAAPASADTPTFVSATVDAKTLKVTFSQDLDTTSRPAADSIQVTATAGDATRNTDGGTANLVSISGKTVTVTLQSQIVHGETVVVSYRKPASNPLQNVAGTDVADFSAQPVTNNTGVLRLSRAAIYPGDRTKLLLVFDRALDTSSTPVNGAFSVKKTPSGGTEATAPLSTTTGPSISVNTVTLTLASAVAATDAVKVSYTKPTTGTNNRIRSVFSVEAASFTDQAVIVSSNRPPTYTGDTDEEVNAPPTTRVSLPFRRAAFSDPDGDTLTHSMTVSPYLDVFAEGTPIFIHGQLFVTIGSECLLEGVDPKLPSSFTTVVTLTATDPDGASATVTRKFSSTRVLGICLKLKSARADGRKLTLTMERGTTYRSIIPWNLPASEFTVKAGATGETKTAVTVASVSVGSDTTADGKTTTPITLTLAEAIPAGHEATVSYDPAVDFLENVAAFTDAEVTVDGSPPQFASAEVAADARTLKVTFDENLDTASAPAGISFSARAVTGLTTVTISGSGTAAISGATATVNLVRAVGSGATVTVSYAKPATNPLQDAGGNETEAFSGKDVTNNAQPLPTLSGARVHSGGTKLLLLFDKDLAAAANLANTAFAVRKKPTGQPEADAPLSGSTAPSISGRTVTLTPASAVASTDTVKVSYTRPTTGTDNRIKSTAGAEADSFSHQAAHNRAPVFTPHDISPGERNEQNDIVIGGPTEISSLPFSWSGFSDPDDDTLTQSITTGRPGMITADPLVVQEQNRVYIQHKSNCAIKALSPTVADNHVTTVTLTVTDPYGESASATRQYRSNYASRFCPELKSAGVRGTALTLTYEHPSESNLPSGLTKAEFTVKVGATEVAVTGISAGTVTTVGTGDAAKKNKPFTLTLAEAVWAGDGQTVTVSYDPADADFHDAPVFTDQAVTVSTANRRPVITGSWAGAAPAGTPSSAAVSITDPDIADADLEIIAPGETATVAANAVTVALSADRDDVMESLGYAGGSLQWKVKDPAALCGLTPRPDAMFATELTVTATDADGASSEVTHSLNTDWVPSDCAPSLVSGSPASVAGLTLTLTFNYALDEDSAPAATDFAVTVAGAARDVSGVAVSGATVVLTLASAVEKGETVTVSYTADAAKPVRRADGVDDPAESFTDQAVDNATGQQPVLEDAVVVGATLTLLYDEALDEDLGAGDDGLLGDRGGERARRDRRRRERCDGGADPGLCRDRGPGGHGELHEGRRPDPGHPRQPLRGGELVRGRGGKPHGRHHESEAAERHGRGGDDHADLRRAAGPGPRAADRAFSCG